MGVCVCVVCVCCVCVWCVWVWVCVWCVNVLCVCVCCVWVVWGIEPRTLHKLSRCSTSELHSQPLIFFWDKFSLCSSTWPWTPHPLAPAFHVLELQVCTIIPGIGQGFFSPYLSPLISHFPPLNHDTYSSAQCTFLRMKRTQFLAQFYHLQGFCCFCIKQPLASLEALLSFSCTLIGREALEWEG
jgi:hypothetical protein